MKPVFLIVSLFLSSTTYAENFYANTNNICEQKGVCTVDNRGGEFNCSRYNCNNFTNKCDECAPGHGSYSPRYIVLTMNGKALKSYGVNEAAQAKAAAVKLEQGGVCIFIE